MTSVSRKESFRYGFYLFAYWLVLVVVSAALVAGGAVVVREQAGAIGLDREGGLAVLGGFVAVLGALVFGSGQVGLVYKLLADGVGAGVASGTRESVGQPAGSEAARTAEAAEGEVAQSTVESADRTGTATAGVAETAATDTADGATGPVDGATTESQGTERRGGESGADPARESDEDRPESSPEPKPRARGGHEAGSVDERAATPAGGREDGTGDGTDGDAATGGGESESTGATTGGADRRESPADVANESSLAEELGFEGAGSEESTAVGSERESPGGQGVDGPVTDDVESPETAVDAEQESGVEPATDAGVGTDPESGAVEEGELADDGGPGSLADALAAEGGDEEGDDSVPEWTTGEDHVDGGDGGER